MESPTAYDVVSKPKHYTSGGIECIDYIESALSPEAYQGFLQGNVTKYLHRWRNKNGVEDLRKARWYLEALIAAVSGLGKKD